jgi:hypothetical protein
MASIPSSPGFRSVRTTFEKAQMRTISPFTFQAQTQLWSGSRWVFEISLPPMKASEASNWITFLHTLANTADTFSKDMSAYIPSGVTGTMTLRLTEGQTSWDVDDAKTFGITFKVEQAQ